MRDLSIEFQLSNEFFIFCSFLFLKTANTFPVHLKYFFKSSDCIFKARYFLREVFFGGGEVLISLNDNLCCFNVLFLIV